MWRCGVLINVEAMSAFICSFNLKMELLDWMFIYRSAALRREMLDNSFSLPLSVHFFFFFKQEKCKSRGNCCQTWHSLIHRFAVLLKWKLCRPMLFHITQGKACRQYYICNLAVALNISMGMTLSYSLTLISITAWLKVWFNFFIQQFQKGVIVE